MHSGAYGKHTLVLQNTMPSLLGHSSKRCQKPHLDVANLRYGKVGIVP
jgi:hypothetical protein